MPLTIPEFVRRWKLFDLSERSGAQSHFSATRRRWWSATSMGCLRLANVEHADAILRYDADGKAYAPEWPKADFIVENPAFLGGKRLRRKLSDPCSGLVSLRRKRAFMRFFWCFVWLSR